MEHLEVESEPVEFRRRPSVVFQEIEVVVCLLLEVLGVLESSHVVVECLGAIVSVLVSEEFQERSLLVDEDPLGVQERVLQLD